MALPRMARLATVSSAFLGAESRGVSRALHFDPTLPIIRHDADHARPAIAAYYQLLGVSQGVVSSIQQKQIEAGQEFLVEEQRQDRGFFVHNQRSTPLALTSLDWIDLCGENRERWSETSRIKYDKWPNALELREGQRRNLAETGRWAISDGGVDDQTIVSLQRVDDDIDLVKTNLLCPLADFVTGSPLSLEHVMHLMSASMHPVYLAFCLPNITAQAIDNIRCEYASQYHLFPVRHVGISLPNVPITRGWIEEAEIAHAKRSWIWEDWKQDRLRGARAASAGAKSKSKVQGALSGLIETESPGHINT